MFLRIRNVLKILESSFVVWRWLISDRKFCQWNWSIFINLFHCRVLKFFFSVKCNRILPDQILNNWFIKMRQQKCSLFQKSGDVSGKLWNVESMTYFFMRIFFTFCIKWNCRMFVIGKYDGICTFKQMTRISDRKDR